MGIWDFISGTTDLLKRNAPDLTTAKNLFSTAYGYGSATVTHIDNAVGGKSLQDEEVRSRILQLGTNIIKHTTIEGLKTIPGYKIFANSIRELKESDKQEVDVKALQADLRRLKKDVSEYRKVHEPEVDVKALQADVVRLEKELSGYRNEHEPEVDVKALQADVVRLEKELSEYRKPREQVQTDKPSAVGNQKSKL